MQNNIRKAFVAALLAVAAFGVSLAAPGGAAPGMPRPPWARPDGVATATSVKTTTARLGSLRRDDTVVVAVEGVVADPGVDTNAVRAIVEEYCGTNIVPRVDAVESGLSDVEEWQRTNGLYSAVAELGDSVSVALAAKADGTVVERRVYSPAMDTNDVWVVDMDGTVLRFLDADPEAGTVTWRGVCTSNTLWVSGSTTSAPPEVAYSLTTLEADAARVLASVAVVDAATGARCGIPRSAFDGAGTGVAYLAPSYDQAGPGDLQYSYTATVRPLGSGVLVFGRTDSGALAEVMRFSRSRIVDAETSVVYDADLRRRLAELRAAVVSRDAATSGFTEWVVSAERPVTGEVVVAAFPAGSAPSGVCDWSLFYADDAVRDDSTRLADVKRASSAATNLVWAASETSWGISVTACRVRVPTVADIEGVQAVAGKHYDDASAMFAKLLHYATNNYYSAYLANERAKNLEAWQYTNAVGRADVERGMTDWAMTPMWPIGYVDAGQVLDGPDAGKWSLFPTGAAHTASNVLLPAVDGAKNDFGDVVELLWPDASWRVEERWTNSLDKLGLRWTPDPGNGYVTAHFDARAARTRVVTTGDLYSLSTNMAQTVTGLVDGVSERLDRLGADLASAARLSLPGECFPVTYMAGSSPPVTIGGADGLSFREDGGVVRMGDAASGRYICSFDPGTLRFLESPYGDALLFGRGYSPGASNEWPVLSVAACGASVVPAGRTVNGKALANDVTLTGADIVVSGTNDTTIAAALAGKANREKLTYSDSWDVYEQQDGGYVFLTGLHTSTTNGQAFTIYGQTDTGYDHGDRLLYHAFGRFYEFFVFCGQESPNGFFVAVSSSSAELDRYQLESDPRVPGASFTAGDYKYVYNGLTTNTVVYSDGLTSVERIARAAAARVDDVHTVSTNALAQATNAVAQVDSLAASKADRTRQSRYGVWYMYAASGPLLETLQYSVSDGRWHGESFTLWYSPEHGTWLYTNGFGSPSPLPGDADATRLDAARSTFRRDRGLVPVVYSDDTVAPSASAAAGAPAEARAVDAALSGKVSKAGDTMAGDLTFGVDYGIMFGSSSAPSKIRSWWDNPDDGMIFNFYGGNDGEHRVQLFCTRPGRIALTAGRGHEGNLAALDTEGNPTDSGLSSGNLEAGTATRLGASTTAALYGTALGRNTKAAAKAVAIGACDDVLPTNASGQGSVAVGFRARVEDNKAAAISIGAFSKTKGEGAIAIGGAATSTNMPAVAAADGAAQIGPGTNDVANSFRFRGTVVVDGNGKIPLSSTDMLDADTGKATFSDGITVQGSGASAMASPSAGSPAVGAPHHSVTLNSDNIVFAATEPGSGADTYTYTFPRESGRLVVDTQLVRRYPMFIIDLNPDDQRIWNHFELKASTNNFTNATSTNMLFFTASTVNGVTNAEFDVGYPYDWCRLYILSGRAGGGTADPRSWTRIRNTAELDTYAPLAVAVIVDMEMLKRGQGSEWLYEDNEEIVWSYLRIGLDSAERDQAGAQCWRPVSPVRWYRKLPQWAEQECAPFSTSGIQPYEAPLDGDE